MRFFVVVTYKQFLTTKVSLYLALPGLLLLAACQSNHSQTPEQQRIDALADNVKAVQAEEQMEKTDGDLLDQSNLADPDPQN